MTGKGPGSRGGSGWNGSLNPESDRIYGAPSLPGSAGILDLGLFGDRGVFQLPPLRPGGHLDPRSIFGFKGPLRLSEVPQTHPFGLDPFPPLPHPSLCPPESLSLCPLYLRRVRLGWGGRYEWARCGREDKVRGSEVRVQRVDDRVQGLLWSVPEDFRIPLFLPVFRGSGDG